MPGYVSTLTGLLNPFMKFLISLLPLSIYLLLSCSKPGLEKPVIFKSVTYQKHHIGTNGLTVLVDTSIHWCRVFGADLARFEAIAETKYLICDLPIRSVLVIGPPCLVGCRAPQLLAPVKRL
jgi:hypothetical protein